MQVPNARVRRTCEQQAHARQVAVFANHTGLLGLRDRIEALGGTLQVTSPVGNGTTLQVQVPLEDLSGPVSPEP